MKQQHFDRIVIGTGGVGSAACYHLAHEGARVLGIDSFPMAHSRGSSHGETRIIRRAYFEHPNYVPLLDHAYQLWAQLQSDVDQTLFEQVGLLEVGPPDGVVISGVRESVSRHNLTVETLTLRELERRHAGFTAPEGSVAIFEPDAGFLHVERCVAAHLKLAIQNQATYLPNTPVRQILCERGRSVVVRTDCRDYIADGIVVCTGAWASRLLPMPVSLKVVRKHMSWYRCEDRRYSMACGAPAFFFELQDGFFYGFPSLDDRQLKIAEHSGGEPVSDPDQLADAPDPQDKSRLDHFLRRCLPGVSTDRTAHQVCMYTMSPDEHFIIDHDPELPQVVYAAGLSGHGFKFASVLGRALAMMSLGREPPVDMSFLSARRFDLAS